MKGSLQIGSILLADVAFNPARKQEFMDLMYGMLADAVEHMTGQRPDMEVQDAPESERSGSA
jgi:hypothetical protein